MVASGNRRLVLAATAALLSTCCTFTPSITPAVMAQVVPTPVQEFAWVRSGPILFIEGGIVNLNSVIQLTTSQSFALDLSVSWPVTAAPWRALTNGSATQTFYAVSSPNNQTILTMKFLAPSTYTIMTYNVFANTWAPPIPVTNVPDILSYGFQPAMDSSTGLVYIAGSASVNAYNFATQTWTAPGPILASMLTARSFGAAVYNPTRKTIMYVGGYNYGIAPTHFDPQFVVTEYAPSGNKWSIMNTTGTPPAPVADHCAAVNDDGSTLIVFGGRTSVVTPAFTGNIFILNVLTGVWTKGPAQATPRIYAACVIVGDQLVVWGGSNDGNNTLPSTEPIVFDLTLNQWTTSYKAPAYYLNNPPTKPTGSTGGSGGSTGGSGGSGSGDSNGSSGDSSKSSSSVSLGPIVGGVVGGLAVIGAIAGFLIYRRRQNKKLEEVKEQVSQQRMVIEAEQSNRVAHNNYNRRNDGGAGSGDTGTVGGGAVSSGVSSSYPMPPTYSPNSNSNTTTVYKFDQSPSSPNLKNTKQFANAVSSPVMSSPTLRTPQTTSNSNYSSQNPQSYQKPMFQAGVPVSGPQEYSSPYGRAPQVFGNNSGNYHEQESSAARQNHPQGGGSGYQ